MTRLALTIISLFVFTIAFSQDSDYIITLKFDTIRGEAKVLSYDLIDRVQLTFNKKKTSYTALQIRRAVVKGEEYAPVKLENAIRMMKIIRSGFVSLYAHRAAGQPGYDTRIIQRVGQNAMEVPNLGFKKIIAETVSDCPEVADKVRSGDFGRNDIEAIVTEYNTCVAGVNQRRIEAAELSSAPASPAAALIDKVKTKVSASDISNKTEVTELLTSVADRVKKKEAVPSYMKEGLKSYLGSREDLKGDLEELLKLLE